MNEQINICLESGPHWAALCSTFLYWTLCAHPTWQWQEFTWSSSMKDTVGGQHMWFHCNSTPCVSHWLKLSPCCFYLALWLHFLPTQTRTSSVPLYAHLMYLWGFRFDMLRTVWVSVYSSYRLFVACFSLDTVLQQLICHDMFLLCLSNSTCCQIQPVVKKLWERVPSVENTVAFFLYLNLFMQFYWCSRGWGAMKQQKFI